MKKQKRFGPLRDLLLSPKLEIATVICDPTVTRDRWQVAADPLARLFLAHNRAEILIKPFVSEDVRAASNAESLFRTNTAACRMIAVVNRHVAGEYLRPLIFPAVTEICSSESDWDQREDRVLDLAKSIMARVFPSASRCPRLLRAVYRHVRAESARRFPQAGLVAGVGSFFFLRFLVPALSSPVVYGITDESLRPSAKRALVLVSTTIQRLASGTLISPTPESRSQGTAEWAEKSFPLLLDFLERLCDVPDEPKSPGGAGVMEEPTANTSDDLALLHDCILKSYDQVREALSKRFPQFDLQAFEDAVTFRKVDREKTPDSSPPLALSPQQKTPASPLRRPDPSPSPEIQPQATETQKKAVADKFCGDLKRELQLSAEAVVMKAEQMYASMAINLDAETARRRKAEAESRALRLELESMRRRYAGDIEGVFAPSTYSTAATAAAAIAPAQSPTISENARKKEILGILEEISATLDDLRRRIDASTDLQDVIFVGKLVRELHTFVQMPLGKQPDVKPIPKQFEVNPSMGEKVKPLRTATVKALSEISINIDKLAKELGPLFQFVDLEQRIRDTHQILRQARHK